MPKTWGSTTERLLQLRPGQCFAVAAPRVDFTIARQHVHGRAWGSVSVEGGRIVTGVL